MDHEQVAGWIETITSEQDTAYLLAAKQEYQKRSGDIFQDDKSYESRISAFLEWFTFEKPLTGPGQSPLAAYLEKESHALKDEDRLFLSSLSQNIHGIFLLKNFRPNQWVVQELFEDKTYRVQKGNRDLPFSKKDLFEGRLFSLEGVYYFTGTYCYHPSGTAKFIQKKIREIQTQEKSSRQQLAALEKQLKQLVKLLQTNDKHRTKLTVKIEKAKKPEKQAQLGRQLDEVLVEGCELETQRDQLLQSIDRFRREELEGALPQRRFDLIQRLSYMSLKWERSRQIDIHDIYCD